ncbi:hypothetical protein DFH06DRAFT_1130131 [Mycena polygramma]|nr:hypothetical protein DFH06DRAFT_1130131 [Mycena polygramma]
MSRMSKTRFKPPSGFTGSVSPEALGTVYWKTRSDSSAATDSSPESSVSSLVQSRISEQTFMHSSGVHIFDIQSPTPFANIEDSSWPAPLASLPEPPSMPQLIPSDNEQHGDLVASYSPPSFRMEVPPSHFTAPTPPGNDPLCPNPHELFELDSAENDSGDQMEELSTIRQLFLHQRFQLGLSARGTTLAALANGVDESLVHPALFHACQLLGYMFAYHLKYKTWRCQTQGAAEELRLAMEALHHPPHPVACLQAVTLISLYCFHVGDIEKARDLIRTGNVYVREHDLGSATPAETQRSTFTVEPTADEEETHAAVAQLAYLESVKSNLWELTCTLLAPFGTRAAS